MSKKSSHQNKKTNITKRNETNNTQQLGSYCIDIMYSIMQVPSLVQHKLPSSSTTMGKKVTPKKAVGFASSTAKFSRRRRRNSSTIFASPSIPSIPQAATIVEMIGSNLCDYELQSTDIRRRYMRRGSKAPTMMQLSKKDRAQIEETTSCHDYHDGINEHQNHPVCNRSYDTSAVVVQDVVTSGRRLSIMSILNCHFDQVTIVDDNHHSQSMPFK
jgi:hypothetical protein